MAATGGIDWFKRPWSPGEDLLLRKLVELHGSMNWRLISRSIPGRSGKSCRLRWCKHLSPEVDHRPFTAEEDEVILKEHDKFGKRWKAAGSGGGGGDRPGKLFRLADSVDVFTALKNVVHSRTSPDSLSPNSEIRDTGDDVEFIFPVMRNLAAAEPVELSPAVVDDKCDNDSSLTALTLRLQGIESDSGTKDCLATSPPCRDGKEIAEKKRETLSFDPEVLSVIKEMIREEVRNYLSELKESE